MKKASGITALLLLGLVGCQGERMQSSLHPSSPAASAIAQLWWVLLVILSLYSLATFVLMLWGIFRSPTDDSSPSREGRVLILGGGVILPAIILVPLLIYSLTTSTSLRMPETELKVRVIGHRWWWEVQYPEHSIITANEIHIPAGHPVELELTASDVIHSFWTPQLHGKMDMLPGQTTSFWIEADRPGTYRGQCAEFCGVQHAHMAFVVEALAPEEFAAWLAANQQLPDAPAGDELQRGRQAFFRHGCAACHAIRGTPAAGRAGPDLTTMGSRQTIAAATLPNTTENLLAWVADPQAIKPGANMPATHASEEDLRAIVRYLQSLQHERNSSE